MSPWVFVLALIVVLARADVQLRRHYAAKRCRRSASQNECCDSLQRLGFASLDEYRASQQWRVTKWRYINSDYPQRCLICGSRDFDLHHRSYARLGHEELFDLVPLCRRHHDQLHELLDPNPELCVKDTHDYLVLLKGDRDSEAPIRRLRFPTVLKELRREPGAKARIKGSSRSGGTRERSGRLRKMPRC